MCIKTAYPIDPVDILRGVLDSTTDTAVQFLTKGGDLIAVR